MIGSSYTQDLQDYFARLQEHYLVIRQSLAGLRLTRWQLARLLLAQMWRDARAVVAATLLLVPTLLVLWLGARFLFPASSLRRLEIPLAGVSKGGKMDFRQMMEDCAKKFPNQPYLIRAFGTEYVVFPSKHFDEIKRLPGTIASAQAFMREAFHEPWSGIPNHSPELPKTVLVDLSRSIPPLVRERQQDCAASCKAVLGSDSQWREITLYSTIEQVVAATNASAFVGRELGTSKAWVSTVSKLPLAVAFPTIILSVLPVILRPFIKPLVFAPVILMRRRLVRMLEPVIKEDIAEFESAPDKKAILGPRAKGKLPLTSWLLRRYPPGTKNTFKRLMDDYINVSFESTPSSAGTLFYILVELAADPGLADLLREEIQTLAPHGELPLTHLNEFQKMDSVMRESARISPFSYLTLYRKLMQPVQLSVGPQLPAGTNICVDAYHINSSPDLWDRPEEYDGLRHYRARQASGNELRFKFANVGSDSPGWGDGAQACPGRIFADNTIKIILTHLLLNYEIKLRPGEGKPKRGSMPNGSFYPDMKMRVLLRSRATKG